MSLQTLCITLDFCVVFQYCHQHYRASFTLTTKHPTLGLIDRTKGSRSFAGCYDTLVYNDVFVKDTISEFTVTLTRLESYVALSEVKVFVGRETSSFHADTLEQDSSRTWLVFDNPGLTTFVVDELDLRGNAHLGIQNKVGSVEFNVMEYKGDFTATLHVGGGQRVSLNSIGNPMMPFNLRTYHVSLSFSPCDSCGSDVARVTFTVCWLPVVCLFFMLYTLYIRRSSFKLFQNLRSTYALYHILVCYYVFGVLLPW